MLENTGHNPIPPENFIKPLQISLEPPWQFVSIGTAGTTPLDLDVEWTRVATNTFELKPLLLNPEDSIELFLFLLPPESQEQGKLTPPIISWSTRVINIREIKDGKNAPKDNTLLDLANPYLSVTIHHSGLDVYMLALITLVFIFLMTLIGIKSQYLPLMSLGQRLLLVLIAGFSFTSADIIVDWIPSGRLWSYSWLLLSNSRFE